MGCTIRVVEKSPMPLKFPFAPVDSGHVVPMDREAISGSVEPQFGVSFAGNRCV